MVVDHWITIAIITLAPVQAWAILAFIPGSAKSSDPFTFISDGDDNTCMTIPHTAPTRIQMSILESWIEDVAWFSIRGHNVGCHTSDHEKLYLMPMISPLSLTDQSAAGGVMKTCTLEESMMDGSLENCTYSCMCPTNCSQVYLVHLGFQNPEWELCSLEFKGIGACGFIECLNGGSCVNLGDNYTCSCQEGFVGRHCETKDCSDPTVISPTQVMNVTVSGTTIQVPVATDADGTVWMFMMRRQDGSVPFQDYTWTGYKNGFGDLSGEFWLGLDNMHLITSNGSTYIMRVDLVTTEDECYYSAFTPWSVGDEESKYQLTWGGVASEQDLADPYYAGDGDYSYHNGMKFSTSDQDNDLSPGPCAVAFHGGWWYNRCSSSKLTGTYGFPSSVYSIQWYSLPDADSVISRYAHLKISVRAP